MTFKLTYSTMFDPPEEMHALFEKALAEVRSGLGATHVLHVGGRDVAAARTCEKRSPVDDRLVLGRFPLAETADADRAMAAAKGAFPLWRSTHPAERVRLVRRVSTLLEERVYAIGAALALEVGKNRMEALGETQETADFFSGYAREYERNGFFDHALPDDPLAGFRSHNRSILKPYGVWVVITPFNFPLALAGGPVAAALVTGNTVVLKGASDTPWSGRLLADCIRDAGFPPGVFNYVTGPGRVVGEALVAHADLAGVTFTGDLERAATGIVRSAFGLTGQKFQPILMVARVGDLREGVARANDSALGLTAGCYGSDEEVRYFLDHIEAGVTYVNRPQGATTGAWPGYQPFGGWKGSGSTGKAIGSFYYLPLYLREQSQTVVE